MMWDGCGTDGGDVKMDPGNVPLVPLSEYEDYPLVFVMIWEILVLKVAVCSGKFTRLNSKDVFLFT